MNKSPITLQSIITDFWQSCAEVMGRMEVTLPEGGAKTLSENGHGILSNSDGHSPSILPESMPVLADVLTDPIDQMDHSEAGQDVQRFDQLTGQALTHRLEAQDDVLLGRIHAADLSGESPMTQRPAAVVMPAPVPLVQLTREAALRFAQGGSFAQTGQDEAVEKSEDEKEEEEKSSLSEKNVQKLIRLGRLKSF